MPLPGIDLGIDTSDQSVHNIASSLGGGTINSGIFFGTPPWDKPSSVTDLTSLTSGGQASFFKNPLNIALGLGIVGGVLLLVAVVRRIFS